MSDIIQFDYEDHWKELEISFERPNSGDKSLGFTIAGGIDKPFINRHFTSIIVTHINENSLAHRDKQLKIYDIILRVNNSDFTNIKHGVALDILRTSGQKVHLIIRRLAPSINEEIELEHNGKIGISIVGGIGNEYFQNDHGIFITAINKSQINKQLDIGDRLLQISSTSNIYDLRFVTHETAKKYIQLSCSESQKIKLYVGHTRSNQRNEQKKRTHLHQGQYNPFGSKDEDSVQIDTNKNSETINAVSNECQADNTNKQNLVQSFDCNDSLKYENCSRIVKNPPLNIHNISRSSGFLPMTNSAVVNLTTDCETNKHNKDFKNVDQDRDYKINNSDASNTVDPKSIQPLKSEESTIASPISMLYDKIDHSITNASSNELNRTNSVAIRDRRSNDEINAEILFHNIISFCRQNKIHFVDDQFPPSSRSLGDNNHSFQWLKITQMTSSNSYQKWTIYSSPKPSDIQQGYLGDCWLMAALTLITERAEMLEHIVLTKTINEQGVYLIRLCHNGLWKIIFIDDYFPCTDFGEVAYAKAKYYQLYIPLIEKACAKLFGSYADLHGGRTKEGLQLLTGAPSHRIELNLNDSLLDKDLIWAKLLSACESKLLIGAATSRQDITEDEYERVHIHMNHVFSILAAHYLTNISMEFVLVRDPHGRTNYQEELITSSILTQLNSIVQNRLPSDAFWISWSVFLQYFSSITISFYTNDCYDIREINQFTQSSIESIPIFHFNISETTLVDISLIYHRQKRRIFYSHTQSFILCHIEDKLSRKLDTNTIILKTRRKTFTHWNGLLKSGFYILIPFSTSFWDEKNTETNRDYTLVIHSKIPIDGQFITESISILTNCLIEYCLKNYSKLSKHRDFNTYLTRKQSGMIIFIAENLSLTNYLNIDIDISNEISMRSSRQSMITHDCIPPHHRQIIFLTESTNEPNQSTRMNYVYHHSYGKQTNDSIPNIGLFQNDFHSYQSFGFHK